MKTRIKFSLIALTAAFVAIAVAASTARSFQDNETGDQKRLRELMIDRRDTIRKQLEIEKLGLRGGRSTIEDVGLVQDRLYLADFDLATSKPERLKILESRVKNLRRVEEYSQQIMITGVGSRDGMLASRERRLAAEIELYRLKTAK